MAHYKVLVVTVFVAMVTAEPPVSGYNYQAPGNSYLPPATGFAPTNSYLPPSGGSISESFNHGHSHSHGHEYNHGHDYNHGNSYNNDHSHGHDHGHDHGHGHGHGHENEVPKSYEFGYSVKDAQSGNDYGRRETSDGDTVRGEYRVALPDGRTQIVTYHADWRTGFHADVRYEGEARYPEPSRNNYHQQGYHYNAPQFAGSLTGFHGNQGYKQPTPVYGPPSYH